MTESTVRSGRAGPVWVVELNRPQALNALTSRMLGELDRALDEAAASDARALLLCSASPKAFSVGTDLNEVAALPAPQIDARNAKARRVLGRLRSHRLLSFAHIAGHALGGGLELALACSFRLLAPEAKLGLPEIKLGVIPTYGGVASLSRLVREDVALDMLASGRSLDVEEALRVGLGTRRLRTGERAEALAVVEEFTGHSLAALALVRSALPADGAEGRAAEHDAIRAAVRLRDFREGVDAFLHKRPPNFRDG